jgi:hypothetical protein
MNTDIDMKWFEITVILTDNTKFNDVLKFFVKPLVSRMYEKEIDFSWHFFREPELRLRFLLRPLISEIMSANMDKQLVNLEASCPEVIHQHYFSCHGEKDKIYTGEESFYGKEAWQLCYKRWEAGSNLALLLCTTTTSKEIPFHYIRDIHLFENQLGLEKEQVIPLLQGWIKKLETL